MRRVEEALSWGELVPAVDAAGLALDGEADVRRPILLNRPRVCLAQCCADGERHSKILADDNEVYAYAHPGGVAWGVNDAVIARTTGRT
jgi:hypothetical protein